MTEQSPIPDELQREDKNMQGLMMDSPLTLTSLMQYSRRVNHGSEVVSVTGPITRRHRYPYAEAFDRTAQLANALVAAGIQPGDGVATMAWNDYRHLELYYAISCIGAVCHMVNPRLFAEQIEFILNHAEDRMVFLDPLFVPLVEGLQDRCPALEACIVLTDDEHMPESGLRAVQSYESFITGHATDHQWPELDEEAACGMCYTSGTTGNPKGVVYSHRSTVLHAWATALPDAMSLSVRDVALPIVPMFPVNAWGIPYATVLAGSKLVLPGPALGDGKTLHDLITKERVTGVCRGADHLDEFA